MTQGKEFRRPGSSTESIVYLDVAFGYRSEHLIEPSRCTTSRSSFGGKSIKTRRISVSGHVSRCRSTSGEESMRSNLSTRASFRRWLGSVVGVFDRTSHRHTYREQRVGAGLARRVCSCGALSISEAPRSCWATTKAGTRCRAWARRDNLAPVCAAHGLADVAWAATLAISWAFALSESDVSLLVGPVAGRGPSDGLDVDGASGARDRTWASSGRPRS